MSTSAVQAFLLVGPLQRFIASSLACSDIWWAEWPAMSNQLWAASLVSNVATDIAPIFPSRRTSLLREGHLAFEEKDNELCIWTCIFVYLIFFKLNFLNNLCKKTVPIFSIPSHYLSRGSSFWQEHAVKVVEYRIRHQIETDDMQFGYMMKGKGTTDVILL